MGGGGRFSVLARIATAPGALLRNLPPLRIRCGWGYRRKEPERGPTMASEICMVLSAMLPWAASMSAEAQAALAAARASGRSRKINGGAFRRKTKFAPPERNSPSFFFFRATPQGFFLGRPVAASFVPPGPGSQTCIHAAILTGKPYLQPYMQPYLPATTLATYLQPYVSCYLTPYTIQRMKCMVLPWDATSMAASSKATKARAALGRGVEMYPPTNPTQRIAIPMNTIRVALNCDPMRFNTSMRPMPFNRTQLNLIDMDGRQCYMA